MLQAAASASTTVAAGASVTTHLRAATSAAANVQALPCGSMVFPIYDASSVSRIGSTYPPSGAPFVDSGWVAARFLSHRTSEAGDYQVTVGLERFDTSLLPDDAVITGARLELHVNVEYDPNDVRQLVGEYYPATNWPADGTDWVLDAPTVAIFAISLASIPGHLITVPLADYDGIAVNDFTGLRLHISGGIPSETLLNYVQYVGGQGNGRLIVDFVRTIQGTLSGVGTGTAFVRKGALLTAQGAGVGTGTAFVRKGVLLTAQGAGAANSTADLRNTVRLQADGTFATASGSASVRLQKPLRAAGIVAATSSVSVRKATALTGALAANSNTAAVAQVAKPLQASIVGGGITAVALRKVVPLRASTVGSGASEAHMWLAKRLSSNSTARCGATASGNPVVRYRAHAAVAVVAIVAGSTHATVPLSGTVIAGGTAAAAVRKTASLHGNMVAAASTDAAAWFITGLATVARAGGGGNASAHVAWSLTSAASALAVPSGALQKWVVLASQVYAYAQAVMVAAPQIARPQKRYYVIERLFSPWVAEVLAVRLVAETESEMAYSCERLIDRRICEPLESPARQYEEFQEE